MTTRCMHRRLDLAPWTPQTSKWLERLVTPVIDASVSLGLSVHQSKSSVPALRNTDEKMHINLLDLREPHPVRVRMRAHIHGCPQIQAGSRTEYGYLLIFAHLIHIINGSWIEGALIATRVPAEQIYAESLCPGCASVQCMVHVSCGAVRASCVSMPEATK